MDERRVELDYFTLIQFLSYQILKSAFQVLSLTTLPWGLLGSFYK